MHKVVRHKRFWKPGTLYSKVDWTDLRVVVEEFRARLTKWYIDPSNLLKGHDAFPVMALNCLLVDTLSQYENGLYAQDPDAFKSFARSRLPGFKKSIKGGIRRGKKTTLRNLADVLYHGFRCGLLHEAGLPPYAAIEGGNAPLVQVELSGLATYSKDGSDCPVVVVNPWKLRDNLRTRIAAYTSELLKKSSRYELLRENFAKKFRHSFGISVPSTL